MLNFEVVRQMLDEVNKQLKEKPTDNLLLINQELLDFYLVQPEFVAMVIRCVSFCEAIQRGGEVRAHVIPNVQRQTIEKQIVDNVGFGAKLYTDELASYARIGTFIKHEVVRHGRGQYVRAGGIHSNSAESFWAIFKRGYHGIYHQMSKKHLQRYVDEYAFRFNTKDDDLGTVFANLVKRVGSSKQLSHKLLTKGAA